jgi:hypothetical protein
LVPAIAVSAGARLRRALAAAAGSSVPGRISAAESDVGWSGCFAAFLAGFFADGVAGVEAGGVRGVGSLSIAGIGESEKKCRAVLDGPRCRMAGDEQSPLSLVCGARFRIPFGG